MAGRGSSQVALRWAAVAAAFVYVGALAAVAFLVQTETSESTFGSSSDGGAYTSSLTVTIEQTLWSAQGAPVAVILGALTAAVLVGATSLARRVSRRSPRAGVGALVVAGMLGVLAVLGLLSVGIFLVPVVAAIGFVGLPLTTFAPKPLSAH